MVAAPAFSASSDFFAGLDNLLFEICEELQITPARYELAGQRYEALNKLLESGTSPFRYFHPEIYPQGSMALGTTAAPLYGPHDLDFVLQLSRHYDGVDPMTLIRMLYDFLRQHGIYRNMTSLKNRCVRIEYTDDFYMDVLPACLDGTAGTCIKVPDCAAKGWTDSNPRGYIAWFKDRSRILLIEQLLEKAEKLPDQQAVSEKSTLQLVVQLWKRQRDVFFADTDPKLAPISIVLTTLAAEAYRGEQSVSRAVMSALNGTIKLIDEARKRGEKHLHLCNPSNVREDLTERWDSNPTSYASFENAVRHFQRRWTGLIAAKSNINVELEALFGEPVNRVLKNRAIKLQESRRRGGLGITSSGLITSAAQAAAPIRGNTFYGEE